MNKHIRGYIGRFFGQLKLNIGTLIVFELLYKLSMILIFRPVLKGLFQLTMKASGLTFLSDETVRDFFEAPQTWILLGIILLCAAFLLLFDICCIITAFHAGYRNQAIPLTTLIVRGAKSAVRIFYEHPVLLVVYLLVIIPLTYSEMISGYVFSWTVPQFIMDYIWGHKGLAVAYVGGMLFVAWKFFPWLYSLHYFTLENCRFKEARQKSRELMHGCMWKDLIVMVCWCVAWLAVYYGITALGGLVIFGINHLFRASDLFSSLTISSFSIFLDVIGVAYYCLAFPMVFLGSSLLFYYHKEKNYEEAAPEFPDLEYEFYIRETNWFHWLLRYRKRIYVTAAAVMIGVTAFLSFADKKGWIDLGTGQNTGVMAHRGYSKKYPENTLESIVGAARIGADFAELDVQQTKDGKVIVMHDHSLERTTGVRKQVWQCTYDEIKNLDNGSWFDKKYSYVRIPTLEQVIRAARGRIRLNIETKPTSHDKDLEEQVVALIKKYHIENTCVVSSLKYKSIEQVKALDPKITTAYIASIAYGDFTRLKAADAYSIESGMVNRAFVRKAHQAGKEVYAWTVDSEDTMENVIACGVDDIITNEPVEAEKLIYDSRHKTFWDTYMNNLLDAAE